MSRFLNKFSRFNDIVIVGGGIVGYSMACSLAKSRFLANVKILLIEAGKRPKFSQKSVDFSNRVFAISPSSVKLFQDIGIWDQIVSRGVKRVEGLYVEDACSKSHIFFDQPKKSPIAYMIESDSILSSLLSLIEKNSIDVVHEVKINGLRIPENLSENVEIEFDDGEVVETSLLIGADGANSMTREFSSIFYETKDYDQIAIVATLKISSINDSENTIAWQRFTPNGPIALLPLSTSHSSLVWTTTTDQAKSLIKLPADQFVDHLCLALSNSSGSNANVNYALGILESLSNCLPGTSVQNKQKYDFPVIKSVDSQSIKAFPLSHTHVRDYAMSRVALIGDAAHRIHPLAGQGVNLGFYDVRSLTNCLESAVVEGGDLGSMSYLKEYDSECKKHNTPITISIDWLNKLYSTQYKPYIAARSLGLSFVNQCTPLKKNASKNMNNNIDIEKLVKQIDPSAKLEPEVAEMLSSFACDMVDAILDKSCQLAKHRNSKHLEIKDVNYVIKHYFSN